MALKLNIGDPKTGKTHKKDLTEDESKGFHGKKIGDKVSGNSVGLSGYEFEVTGGSDNAGFPMRKDVQAAGRKRVLLTKSLGFKTKRKGERRRRTVAGNTISTKTVQVNMKILKQGTAPISAPAVATEKDAPEAPKEEVKEAPRKEPETAKEEPKAEEKPAGEAPKKEAKEAKEKTAEKKE